MKNSTCIKCGSPKVGFGKMVCHICEQEKFREKYTCRDCEYYRCEEDNLDGPNHPCFVNICLKGGNADGCLKEKRTCFAFRLKPQKEETSERLKEARRRAILPICWDCQNLTSTLFCKLGHPINNISAFTVKCRDHKEKE